jgi:hypothetical protein
MVRTMQASLYCTIGRSYSTLLRPKEATEIAGTYGSQGARATSLLTQSMGEGFYKQLCAEQGF